MTSIDVPLYKEVTQYDTIWCIKLLSWPPLSGPEYCIIGGPVFKRCFDLFACVPVDVSLQARCYIFCLV